MSEDHTDPAVETRRRKIVYAVLLAMVIGMGAGQLYSGNLRRALAAAGLTLLALFLVLASAMLPPDSTTNLALGLILAVACPLILLGIVVDAGVGARRVGAVSRDRLYPVWAYILIFVVSGAANLALPEMAQAVARRVPYAVPGASMVPALQPGDLFFGHRGHYDDREPRRGEIVLFPVANNRPYGGPAEPDMIYFVKRVVALPGETVGIRQGILHIDGVAAERQLVEAFALDIAGRTVEMPQYLEILPGGASHRIVEANGDAGPRNSFGPVVVLDGHVFVLGDNRDNSVDSRQIGPVPIAGLTSRAEIIYWSNDFGRVGRRLHPSGD